MITALTHAFLNSLKGLKVGFMEERAIRQEVMLFLVLISLLILLDFSTTEKAILLLNMFLILITEFLNSAVEAISDRVSMEHHELIAKAKDTASAAVFIGLISLGVLFLMFLIY